MIFHRLLLFLVLAVSVSSVYSQEEITELDFNSIHESNQSQLGSSYPVRYEVAVLGNDKGLNSSDISALHQDKDGFIWVGTKPGISRFDGYDFENFTKGGNDFLGQIHSIVEDSAGTIWIGGVNGLFIFRDGEFHPTSLDSLVIRTLHFGLNNELWVGGLGFIPFTLPPSDLLKLQENESIQTNPIVSHEEWEIKIGSYRVWDIDTDNEGIAWLGLDNRRASYDGKELHVHWADSTDLHKYVAVAAFKPDSIFWGSEKTPLIFQNSHSSQPLNNSITYIFHVSDLSFYFLTTTELWEVKNGKWRTLHYFGSNNKIYFKKMIRDKEGNFWIGAEGNLIKLTPIYFDSWTASDFPILHSNYSIAELQDGEILVGSSQQDVIIYRNNSFSSFSNIDVPFNSFTQAIHQAENGWIWYASSMSGLILDRNGIQEKYTDENGLGNNGQYFIHERINGEIWCGGDGVVSRINVDQNGIVNFDNYLFNSEEDFPVFRDILEGPEESLWAISDKGLFILNEKGLERQAFSSPATPYPIITASTVDSKGQLWLSTQGEGLWQCHVNEQNGVDLFRQWTVEDDLISDVILDLHLDKTNRIWVVSQNGICSLNLEETSPSIRCFDSSDGWLNDPSPHYQLMESKDGKLWALGISGIASFPLYQLPTNEVPPKTFITEVQLFNGKEDIFPYAQNTEEHSELPINLILPHNKNFVSFQFTTTSHARPDKNQFRYKLEGLDPDWNDAGQRRSILYPGLQSGMYTFKVQASNNDGVQGIEIATFSFEVLSPWYRLWWAYASYVTILGLFLFVLYKIKLERKLSEAEKVRLTEVNRLKNNLYNNITHEFRTPLTVIQGMTESLRSNIERKEFSDAGKSIEMIRRNGSKLLRLVNEMLDLAKLESGKSKLNLIQTDIIPFVKYLGESFHSLAEQKNINLTVYSEVDSLEMDIDANKLSTIVSNLLSNAIKFTDAGGKVIVHLNKIDKNGQGIFFLKVKDNGVGLTKAELSSIFNRFYQADLSSTRTNDGTGIGLALTKELVDLMKGTIQVNSYPGKGSDFIVLIPINRVSPISKEIDFSVLPLFEDLSNQLLFHEDKDDNTEQSFVLIIEDNLDVAYYLKTCLKGKYQSIHATDGEEGLELAFERIPDIIISDVMMPGMDGFEVCKTLKSDPRTDHIPIVLLTAKVGMKDRLTGLSLGADAYLTKPFVKAELFTRLDQLILLRKKMMQRRADNVFSHMFDQQSEAPEDRFLKKCLTIIHGEINNHAFGSALLAHKVHLSESQVYRKLKAITGKSTAVFIRSVRLQRGKELVQSTDKTISEVAYEVGFNDPSWFSRAFKEEFGYAPSALSK